MLNMQGDVMMQRVKSVRQGTCKRVKKKDKDKHWHTKKKTRKVKGEMSPHLSLSEK